MSTVREPSDDFVLTHPNRDSAASKATRGIVLLLLAAGAVLSAVILVLSWGVQMGAIALWIVLTVLYAYFAYAVSRWRSGVLPVAAGTALITGVFAAVSVSSWFNRGGTGYDQPAVPESVIGVLVLAFAVLQIVTVVLCLRGFMQNWHVELEVPRHELRGRTAVA